MTILSLLPIKIGQVGVQPNIYKMTTTDSLAVLITPSYLQQYAGGNYYVNNDVIETIYLYGTPAAANTNFIVSVNAITGVISLTTQVPAGIGTAAGKNASNNSNPVVASIALAPYAPLVGSIATFIDAAGTIGYNPNNFTAKRLIVTIASTSYTLTDANCSTASIVFATLTSTTNPSYIAKIAPGNGNFVLTFSATPGTTNIMYMITNPQ